MTNWYPITPIHPAPLVQVRGIVMYPGGAQDAQIIISRGRPPHSNTWASWAKGRAAALPPHAKPLYWQPQAPDKWQASLPTPVSNLVDRMWSSSMTFGVVDDAEAAELAREMEADRADARRGAVHSAPSREPLQWWRDADKIRYERAGEISERNAEGRIMRAVSMCGHGAGLSLRTRTFGTILANMAAQIQGEDYATSDYVPRLRALPADETDFPIAMDWFTALNPMPIPAPGSRARWDFNRAQEALAFRSFNIPLSFDDIGGQWNVSGETARQTYIRTIATVCRIANGSASAGVDHMSELRERNAAWKRKGHNPVSIHADALEALDKGAA